MAIRNVVLILTVGLLAAHHTVAQTPSTTIASEYLMTVHFVVEPAQTVDDRLRTFNLPTKGSWVEGPKIKAKVVPPSGDWAVRTPGGQTRLDVRVTLETDDGEIIFMSYAGVVELPADVNELIARGDTLSAGDAYWITAPTFATKATKYSWLNGVQAVGKMISWKANDHVTYDIFVIK